MPLTLPAALLNRQATIYRSMGRVQLPSGGWRDSRPTIVGASGVRLVPAGGSEVSIAGHLGALVTTSLYFPAGTDVQRGDLVEVAASGSHPALRFEVAYVMRPSEPTYLKALSAEVQRGAN